MATTVRTGLIDRLDRRAGRIPGRPGEARAEDRVDNHPGALDSRGQLRRDRPGVHLRSARGSRAASSESWSAGASSRASTSNPISRKRPRRDQAVPAVVALAADDRGLPEPAGLRRGLGDRPAGRLHQLQRGNALLLDRPAIGRPHLVGVETRIEPFLHDRASLPRRTAVLRSDCDRGGAVARMGQRRSRSRSRPRPRLPARAAAAGAARR